MFSTAKKLKLLLAVVFFLLCALFATVRFIDAYAEYEMGHQMRRVIRRAAPAPPRNTYPTDGGIIRI